MATQAHRGASPSPAGDTGSAPTALPRELALQLPLDLPHDLRQPRRRRSKGRVERRRTGPCTVSYRLVAARAGARVLRPPAWLRAVRASPALAVLRADRARTVLDVAGVIALAARADSTAAPTWPVLVERSGYSRATIARVLAWLRAHQLLVTLENGSTPQYRPTPRPRRDRPAPVEVEGNRAAVYLLTEPLPEEDGSCSTGQLEASSPADGRPGQGAVLLLRRAWPESLHRLETPPHHPSGAVEDQPRTSARETTSPPGNPAPEPAQKAEGRHFQHHAGTEVSQVPGVPGYRRGGADGSRGTRGQQRAEDLALAQALRTRSLDLRPISPQAIRAVVRPFLAAGWQVEDLVWAIDHDPDGRARTFTAGPRHINAAAHPATANNARTITTTSQPADVLAERRQRRVQVDDGAPPARAVASPAAWLAWRLAAWVGPTGLLPAPAQARRAAARAEQATARTAAAARRQAAAAATAAAVPPPVAWAEARAELRARRGLRDGFSEGFGNGPGTAGPETGESTS